MERHADLDDYSGNERSPACYEREIKELKEQRDALLEACEFGNASEYYEPLLRDVAKIIAEDHPRLSAILLDKADKEAAAISKANTL